MINLILGIVMLGFAAISVRDAARITAVYRKPGAFDVVGPDRYMEGVAIVVGVIGLALVLSVLLAWARRTATRAAARRDDASSRHLSIMAIIIAYAALMPILGYTPATLLFFLVTFAAMGVRGGGAVVTWSIASTAGFYAAFIKLADMPLPQGWLPLD